MIWPAAVQGCCTSTSTKLSRIPGNLLLQQVVAGRSGASSLCDSVRARHMLKSFNGDASDFCHLQPLPGTDRILSQISCSSVK